MRNKILAAVALNLAFVLLGTARLDAADVLQRKLVGRWELDSRRTHSLGGKSAVMVGQYQRAGLRMFLEFRSNKTAVTTVISPAGRSSSTTKWKVVDENVRQLTFEMSDEKTRITSLGTGEFLNDDVVKVTTRIKGTQGNSPAMIYRRIR